MHNLGNSIFRGAIPGMWVLKLRFLANSSNSVAESNPWKRSAPFLTLFPTAYPFPLCYRGGGDENHPQAKNMFSSGRFDFFYTY